MTDRNQTYQNGRVFTHSDVQRGSANRQTFFSGTGQYLDKTALFSAHCQQVPKTHHSSAEHRRPHTASKINVIHHLALQSEALVILLQETHRTADAEKLILSNYQLAGSSLSRKHGLATFIHEQIHAVMDIG